MKAFRDLHPATIEEINSLIGGAERPAFLYAYSDDCIGCVAAKPKIEAAYHRHGHSIPFALVNVQALPEVWEAFGLASIPTILLVGNDQALLEIPVHLSDNNIDDAIADARQIMKQQQEF